jgi:WD40 repeat protein
MPTIAEGQTLLHGGLVAPDGRTALSGSDNKTLKLWDLT